MEPSDVPGMWLPDPSEHSGPPPEEALGDLSPLWEDFLQSDFLQLDSQPELRRTAYWSLRLMLAMDEHEDSFAVPGLRHVAFGFVDLDRPVIVGVNPFGVALIAEKADGPVEDSSDVIDLEGVRFPVVVRRLEEREHGPSVRPDNGSSGCWARSRRSSRRPVGPGVLTAKHVIDANNRKVGADVYLSSGKFGKVLDLGPECIDAAIVSTQEMAGTIPLRVQQFVVAGTPVSFDGAFSRRTIGTQVLSVTDVRGAYVIRAQRPIKRTMTPSRVFLSDAGKPGDSGALVEIPGTGVAVGIYMGDLVDRQGHRGGVAQHAYQAVLCMDMELYR